MPILPICHLCKKGKTLCQSHIVPEFLHTPIYNEKRQIMGIHGLGNRGSRLLQQGLTEPLLCSECERFLNDEYEKPFKQQWLDTNVLPSTWKVTEPYYVQVDYRTFKLFHLSVLYRASVSSLRTFEQVNLGIHEARLRKMILDSRPGKSWEYPIVGFVTIDPRNNKPWQFISAPFKKRVEDLTVYEIVYGGVEWIIGVASHRTKLADDLFLQADGRMPLYSVAFNEMGIIKTASQALNNPHDPYASFKTVGMKK